MIGANRGIGALVLQAGNLMQTDQLLAGVVLLSLLGLSIAGVIGLIETLRLGGLALKIGGGRKKRRREGRGGKRGGAPLGLLQKSAAGLPRNLVVGITIT